MNPFDYLTELLRNAFEGRDDAEAWMPWTYRDTLRSIAYRSQRKSVNLRGLAAVQAAAGDLDSALATGRSVPESGYR